MLYWYLFNLSEENSDRQKWVVTIYGLTAPSSSGVSFCHSSTLVDFRFLYCCCPINLIKNRITCSIRHEFEYYQSFLVGTATNQLLFALCEGTYIYVDLKPILLCRWMLFDLLYHRGYLLVMNERYLYFCIILFIMPDEIHYHFAHAPGNAQWVPILPIYDLPGDPLYK